MNIEQLRLKREELPILGNTHKIFFQVPIHPKLLDNSINIERSIAQRIIPLATDISFMDNGLVKSFSMYKDDEGVLFFKGAKLNYKSHASTFINFSEEKYKEFASEKGGNDIFVYSHKNVDRSPEALFLRDWAIKYMNEVFKQVF
jgi:hypothetical protein